MRHTTSVLFLAIVLHPMPALAYIDPGSGSAIMSAVIGFLVALGLALKTYAYKIKAIFGRKEPRPEEPQEENEVPKRDAPEQ